MGQHHSVMPAATAWGAKADSDTAHKPGAGRQGCLMQDSCSGRQSNKVKIIAITPRENFKGIMKNKAILMLCFEGSHVLSRIGDIWKQIGAYYSRLGEYLTTHTTTPNLTCIVCALSASDIQSHPAPNPTSSLKRTLKSNNLV